MCMSFTTCTYPEGPFKGFLPLRLSVGERLVASFRAEVPQNVEGPLQDTVRVSGGGVAPQEVSGANVATAKPPFGKFGFKSSLTNTSKRAYTQAGGHPYEFTTEVPVHDVYSVEAILALFRLLVPFRSAAKSRASGSPHGIPRSGPIVNPEAVPHCKLAEYFVDECPPSTMVGTAGLFESSAAFMKFQPVFNLEPGPNSPGELGIEVNGAPFIHITSGVRSDGDYGVTATSFAVQQDVNHVAVTLWGVPADPSHDGLRGLHGGPECSDSSLGTWAPYFMNAEEIERSCEAGLEIGPVSCSESRRPHS